MVDGLCATTTRKPWQISFARCPPRLRPGCKAAQEIPLARRGLDDIVERARADQAFRDALIVDLEQALEAAGFEPDPALADAVRARLSI